MVLIKISVNAKSMKRTELLSACQLIIDQTRQEKGCLSCCHYQDVGDEDHIYLEETWEGRSFMEEHFRSDIFTALLGAIKFLGVTHEISITEGSRTEGIEVVHAARLKEDVNDQ
jgi:quinol monooxygenase YgiN